MNWLLLDEIIQNSNWRQESKFCQNMYLVHSDLKTDYFTKFKRHGD